MCAYDCCLFKLGVGRQSDAFLDPKYPLKQLPMTFSLERELFKNHRSRTTRDLIRDLYAPILHSNVWLDRAACGECFSTIQKGAEINFWRCRSSSVPIRIILCPKNKSHHGSKPHDMKPGCWSSQPCPLSHSPK